LHLNRADNPETQAQPPRTPARQGAPWLRRCAGAQPLRCLFIVWEFAFFLIEIQIVSPDRELWGRTQTIPSSSPPAGRIVQSLSYLDVVGEFMNPLYMRQR
jgi:hypothetical protein